MGGGYLVQYMTQRSLIGFFFSIKLRPYSFNIFPFCVVNGHNVSGSPGEGNGSSPVFLSGKFHGQRSLVGYSSWCHKESVKAEHTRE